MKKITFFAIALALVAMVLSGCQKKEATVSEPQSKQTVQMTFHATSGAGERTSLVGNKSVWTAGDQIKIFSTDDKSGSPFTLEGKGGSEFGDFTGEGVESTNYAAAYPESLASSTDGSTITFNLPGSQKYAENSYAENTVPVVSYSSSNELVFDNTTGLLRLIVRLKEGTATVTSMVIKDKDSSAKLWGIFKVTAPQSALEYISGGDNTLTIDLGEGVALSSSEATSFHFCLPVGTIAGGFTVEMADADGKTATIDYSGEEKVSELNRGKIYEATEVEFNESTTVTDACGNTYPTVVIGEQVWMAENMRCKKYSSNSEAYNETWLDDHSIPFEFSGDPHACYLDASDESNWYLSDVYHDTLTPEQIAKLGYVYSWAAAVGVHDGYDQTEPFTGHRQGICPNGWHLPTADEWNTLVNYIETTDGKGAGTAGYHLKTTSGWNYTFYPMKTDGNGLDTYDFAALPAGVGTTKGVDAVSEIAEFWTATLHPNSSQHAYPRRINWHKPTVEDDILSTYSYKSTGLSVRCLKN